MNTRERGNYCEVMEKQHISYLYIGDGVQRRYLYFVEPVVDVLLCKETIAQTERSLADTFYVPVFHHKVTATRSHNIEALTDFVQTVYLGVYPTESGRPALAQ